MVNWSWGIRLFSSDEEKRRIFDTFKEGNLKLAEEFQLDKERMKKYGYF